MEEEIKKDVQSMLTPFRYEHCVRTAKKAEELAIRWGYSPKIARIVALAHDMAKDLSYEQYLQYAQENEIILSKEDKLVKVHLHGIIAAKMCEKKYQFTKEMTDAIFYHTTARNNMTLLDKIIYVADKIEDGRDYEGIEELRIMAMQNLDEAILESIHYSIKKCIKQQKYIHSLSIVARNDLLSKRSNRI